MYSHDNCEVRQITTSAVATNEDSAAWLFPGLGSRHVGMGGDIFGHAPLADELLSIAEQFVGYDVAEVCLTGSGRKHVPSRVEAQVIYLVNCAYARVLTGLGVTPNIVSGHSLGTWAAAYAAGVIDFQTGLELVTRVEDLLEEHSPAQPQAMGVIIGLSEEAVVRMCTEIGDIFLANRNSPGQYVISGIESSLESALERAAREGAYKAKRIAGHRAMHTRLLTEVSDRLCDELSSYSIADAVIPLVNCFQGGLLRRGDTIRAYLGEFLKQPVDWEGATRCLIDGSLIEGGGRRFLEVGAGGILTGMMPFIDRDVEVETASDRLTQIEERDQGLPSHLCQKL